MVCPCCVPPPCTSVSSSQFVIYSAGDTIPPAPDPCDCNCYGGCDEQNSPDLGQLCFDPDNPCTQADCCGEELACYVRSSDVTLTGSCQPRAVVFRGALFDDHGTIEGQDRIVTLPDPCVVNDPPNPSPTRPLPSDETFVPFVVDNGDGTSYLKLNLVAKNGQQCGTYGLVTMSVRWYFG